MGYEAVACVNAQRKVSGFRGSVARAIVLGWRKLSTLRTRRFQVNQRKQRSVSAPSVSAVMICPLPCLRCTNDTYSDESFNPTCKDCPAHSASDRGSDAITDCVCNLGFYLREDDHFCLRPEFVLSDVVQPANFPTALQDAYIITVSGEYFGSLDRSPAGRMGGTTVEASEWVSDSSIRCSTASGIGTTLDLAVTVGRSTNTAVFVVSYAHPEMSAVPTSNIQRGGAAQLLVIGRGLGAASYSARARTDDTSCAATSWVSDSTVLGKVAHGSRNSVSVMMTVGSSAATVSQAASFNVPAVSWINTTNTAGRETVLITVSGDGFGLMDGS
eukprot:3218554-Rhodomonas_salina.1